LTRPAASAILVASHVLYEPLHQVLVLYPIIIYSHLCYIFAEVKGFLVLCYTCFLISYLYHTW